MTTALNFGDANPDDLRRSRTSKYADSPFVPEVEASHASGNARYAKLPKNISEDEVKRLVAEVRYVASSLGFGIKVRVLEDRLVFQAGNKRTYTRSDAE